MREMISGHKKLRDENLSSLNSPHISCRHDVVFSSGCITTMKFSCSHTMTWTDVLQHFPGRNETAQTACSATPSSTNAQSILVHSLNRYPSRNQQLQYSAAVTLTGAWEDSDHTQTKQVCAHQYQPLSKSHLSISSMMDDRALGHVAPGECGGH